MTEAELKRLETVHKAHPEYGRIKLSKATGVSEDQARAYLKGAVKMSEVKPIKTFEEHSFMAGISLKSARVSDFKPQDGVKRKLYSLKRGSAYPLSQVVEQWGFSEERIRKEAKRFDCLKYVEVSPGEWVSCVIHPDTAEEISKQKGV